MPRRQRHPGLYCLRRSIPRLHAPLRTLRRRPREHLRTARDQCGSLLLHCSGLAPLTPCRSPGALTHGAACTRARPPIRDLLSEGFSHFVSLCGAFFVRDSNLAPLFFFFCCMGRWPGPRHRCSGLRDNQRGNPPSYAAPGRDTTLYSLASCETDHDAVIRILGEVPRRRLHSPCRRLKPL